jgi:hypothetical protein
LKKTGPILCLFCCCLIAARAQPSNASTIMYVGKVPIVTELRVFVKGSSDGLFIPTVSGTIRVALVPLPPIGVDTDQFFEAGTPLATKTLQQVEYAYGLDSTALTQWKPLPARGSSGSFPYGALLLDTFIPAKSKLYLRFRLSNSRETIQEHVYTRTLLLPTINGYLQRPSEDSISSRVQAKAVNHRRETGRAFDTLIGSSIELPAGNQLELRIKKSKLSRDSCIEYRLQNRAGSTVQEWQLSGHLLTLNKLEPGQSYLLQVRYVGMDAWNSYTISTLPYWYQTTMARALFLLLALWVLLVYRRAKRRRKHKREKDARLKASEQMKALQNQLNPHFIYNSMNSVEALIANGENERASEYLAHFSELMQETFSTNELALHGLSQDIAMMERYIRIQQLRFEFGYSFYIDPLLNLEQVELPPLLLQPCIENAITHGVNGMGSKGHIALLYRRLGSSLQISITDNGSGQSSSRQGLGAGLRLTRERIEHFGTLHKLHAISLNMEHGPSGTTVTFLFNDIIIP